MLLYGQVGLFGSGDARVRPRVGAPPPFLNILSVKGDGEIHHDRRESCRKCQA